MTKNTEETLVLSNLIEGKDFYYNEDGLMIFTAHFLKKRGFCCQSGCTHCPYGIHEKYDPSYPQELQNPPGDESDYYDHRDFEDDED